MRNNEGLKDLYQRAFQGGKEYAGGENSFFTFSTADITEYILENVDFKGKDILEVGCGTGDTAFALAQNGAGSVVAIDYSEEAIKTCKKKYRQSNLEFEARDYRTITDTYDIVLLQEVIEHMNDPAKVISGLMKNVKDNGTLILTCPNFTNIRGYIWMTLQILFDVPMSLSDIHFFSPFDFEEIAQNENLKLKWKTFAHDRVVGEKLIADMRKRLKNALKDKGMDNSKVDDLLDWISKVVKLDNQPTQINGGKGFYVFSSPNNSGIRNC